MHEFDVYPQRCTKHSRRKTDLTHGSHEPQQTTAVEWPFYRTLLAKIHYIDIAAYALLRAKFLHPFFEFLEVSPPY